MIRHVGIVNIDKYMSFGSSKSHIAGKYKINVTPLNASSLFSYFLFVNYIVKLQIATTRERPKKSTLFIMQPMNIQCRFLGTIMRFTKVIV